MLAEPRAQALLLDLAAVDTEIAKLLHRRQTLPEHEAITALAEDRKKVTARLVSAATAVSDAEYALERAEKDIEPVRERIARDQRRLESGSVSDPKTVASLVDEVAHLERRLRELEDIQLEAMEEVENATARREATQAERDAGDVDLRALMVRRDETVAAIDADVADRRSERGTIAAELPQDLVSAYDKTRERSGPGAAKLHQGRCSGCGLELNPAELRRIATSPPNEVLRCEECGRILVRTDESGL